MMYDIYFVIRVVIRSLLYILCESVAMVATLQSLNINISVYVQQMTEKMYYTPILNNPIMAIGFLNIFMVLFVAWDLVTDKYILKDD